MQNRKSLFVIVFLVLSAQGFAQTTNIPLWAKENWLLNRLEIKAQKDNDLNLSTIKPYMRKVSVAVADSFRAMLLKGQNPAKLTPMDQYNLDRFESNNKEYSRYTSDSFPDWKKGFLRKKPWGKYFFPSAGNLVEVNIKDFYLSVNPVCNFQYGKESDNDNSLYINTKGATLRGLIAKRIGFDFYITDNQERGPSQYTDYVIKNHAVPGNAFYKVFKDNQGYDYFDARGSVTANVTKYINLQFGYDKNFIGNGHRSLFLSDFGAPTLFFKINTRIWKLNYTNLYMELFPRITNTGGNLLDRKYATMHHLGINVTKWLNIGFFESIIFGRPNHYDFSYLVPVIFLRSIEGNNGSPDNANIGFDVKANLFKTVQLYGQLMFDEFNFQEWRKQNGWYGNKQAFQLGAKYVDAFGLNDLDLQFEWNHIRPFTYQHFDSLGVGNYTSYNQPLAHSLGANVQEIIGIVRYQPLHKLYVTGKAMYYKQGLDSAGYNFGSDPRRNYNEDLPLDGQGNPRRYGYDMFSGDPATCLYISLTTSYELFENFFVDLTGVLRNYKQQSVAGEKNTNVFSLGVRWNMFRREYDY